MIKVINESKLNCPMDANIIDEFEIIEYDQDNYPFAIKHKLTNTGGRFWTIEQAIHVFQLKGRLY